MSRSLSIAIADSSAIIRSGVTSVVQSIPALRCEITELSDLGVSNNSSPFDILIINPSMVGLYPLSQLRENFGGEALRIVALQNSYIESSTLQGYDEVISIYDSPESITDKISAIVNKPTEVESKRELSAREKEIIVCVVKGQTNKQIADSLCLSTHTVIAHRRNIASKLQIHSPSGLTIYAIVNKLVDLSDVKNSISQSREE